MELNQGTSPLRTNARVRLLCFGRLVQIHSLCKKRCIIIHQRIITIGLKPMKLPLSQVFSKLVDYFLPCQVMVVFMVGAIVSDRVFFPLVLPELSLKEPVTVLSSRSAGLRFRTLNSGRRTTFPQQEYR